MKFFNYWWIYTIKGIIFFVIGIIALLSPDMTLISLLTYLGIIILTFGIILLANGIYRFKNKKDWRSLMYQSILDIIIGIIIISFPKEIINIFIILFSIIAIILGIYLLIISYKIQSKGISKNTFLLTGVLSLIIGILFLFNPFEGAMLITSLAGILFLILGLIVLYTSINMRRQVKLNGFTDEF